MRDRLHILDEGMIGKEFIRIGWENQLHRFDRSIVCGLVFFVFDFQKKTLRSFYAKLVLETDQRQTRGNDSQKFSRIFRLKISGPPW